MRERGRETARQCRQLEKRRNSWSVSDIIVVGVSGVGQSRVGRKEEEAVGGGRGACATRRTRRRVRRSHMQHRDDDDDDDTIWSFAPEACDNITATCYVPRGRRHAWQLLTPTKGRERNQRARARPHTCQGERGMVWPEGRKGMAERKRKWRIGACSAGFSVFGFVGFVRFSSDEMPHPLPFSPTPVCYQHSRSPSPLFLLPLSLRILMSLIRTLARSARRALLKRFDGISC